MSDSDNKAQIAEPESDERHAENEVSESVGEKPVISVLPTVVALSLLLSLGAMGASAYMWYVNQQQLLTQTRQEQSMQQTLSALQQQLQTQKSNLRQASTVQATLQNQQQQLNERLDQISEKLGRNRHDWAIAEIRYTLRQANLRLQLFGDKATALVALRLADEQLAKLAEPALHKVRAQLNQDIAALAAVKEVDIEGVSLTLTALASQVNGLQVAITTRSKRSDDIPEKNSDKAPETVAWKKHAAVIWSELKTLVSIRRTDRKILPLLSEQELKQLQQALGLKIEIARLALLQADSPLFKASMQQASEWLESYFNTEHAAVSAMVASINKLKNLELQADYPDISQSLALLESMQVKQNILPATVSTNKKPEKEKQIK